MRASSRIAAIALLSVLLLAACGPLAQPAPPAEAPLREPEATSTPAGLPLPPAETAIAGVPSPPDESAVQQGVEGAFQPLELPPFEGARLPVTAGEWMSTSGACAACHTAMLDAAGEDVSMERLWRGSMMANAARDPYWQATVEHEALTFPELAGAIEDTCARCHTPMARFTQEQAGEAAALLGDGLLAADHPLHDLAIDGVSCTLCHQVEPDNFGQAASFSGGYLIDPDLPAGERLSYGPFPVAPGLDQLMQGASGFVPVQGDHVRQAEQCAVCHMLYTPTVGAAGEIVGQFPEQMTYLEWQSSAIAGSQTCQDCHMPPAEGAMSLSVTGGPPRQPVARHSFAGGNSTILGIMRAYGEEIGVTASSAHFDAAITRMVEQMQTSAAALEVISEPPDGSALAFDVTVSSLVGHKFPSGFPSRRLWLHVIVQGAEGAIVFESGAYGQDGAIVGNANDDDPLAYEPHYDVITAPDEVQIYEAILGDEAGAVTMVLLHGVGYLKDNRLLPSGFDVAAAPPDIAVYGEAAGDDDFSGGGDTVSYRVDVGDAAGPFTVTVRLYYQSIGYRWAESFRGVEGSLAARFVRYYDGVPNLPVMVGEVVTVVEP
ncbi:MAG: hypothetical protein Kow00124_16760 [Anaerolineae bacterium]